MKKLIYLFVLVMLVSGCATYSAQRGVYKEFEFGFQKRLFFNTYHLQIINHSPNRTIQFNAGQMNDNYVVVLNNGGRVRLDSKVFYYIGSKGGYWVNPGYHGSIPFEISQPFMQKVREIVFNGLTYILRYEGNFSYCDDAREIIITVKIPSREIVVTEGKLIQPSNDLSALNYILQNNSALHLDNERYDIKLRKTKEEIDKDFGLPLK